MQELQSSAMPEATSDTQPMKTMEPLDNLRPDLAYASGEATPALSTYRRHAKWRRSMISGQAPLVAVMMPTYERTRRMRRTGFTAEQTLGLLAVRAARRFSFHGEPRWSCSEKILNQANRVSQETRPLYEKRRKHNKPNLSFILLR